jgi:SPX domain protein involved in polyphosphate accumulation/uncharacterized membrane protein YidH (DUF202 family)
MLFLSNKMKFGEFLLKQRNPEWFDYYLDYNRLKDLIRDLHDKHEMDNEDPDGMGKGTSLSVPPPTNAAAQPVSESNARERGGSVGDVTQESFYEVLETEMKKIETFTKNTVREMRNLLQEIEQQTSELVSNDNEEKRKELTERTKAVGKDFLKLEKYVNLNFSGFHKILKKHDRWLPNPCKAFYLTRLHDQRWVRGDYSDIIVSMSDIYSVLRGDEKVEEKDSGAQSFVRSTRKYWVHTEDVSKVKYQVLQELPVFLQKDEIGELLSVDSQLVNSVYLDNYAMELYHGRLDKTPGAIALRFRWYGTSAPTKVFVERKTHQESWTGDISVKERFVVDESEVLLILKGEYDIQGEAEKMRLKGKSEDEVDEWFTLASEICDVIISKQLLPVIRTQYMRTAFQIPFDATVRISLDTNLCMIVDRTKDTSNLLAWYRDPLIPVPLTQITRFPHAVLEVKLQIEEGNLTPQWVQKLLDGGMVMQVHKFSKFIHGAAVLMPEEVRGIPYWIDDSSLKDSITRSGAQRILTDPHGGANEIYDHLLPHDSEGNSKIALEVRKTLFHEKFHKLHAGEKTDSFLIPNVRAGAAGYVGETEDERNGPSYVFGDGVLQDECMTCDWAQQEAIPAHIVSQKVEPKLFFANERTFIKWMHMAVILSGVSTGVLAFSNATSYAQDYAVMLLPISLMFIGYALSTFLWRCNQIKTRSDLRWDDPMGPVVLTCCLIVALVVQFVLKLRDLWINQY